jgi:hypothetical protein
MFTLQPPTLQKFDVKPGQRGYAEGKQDIDPDLFREYHTRAFAVR